MKKTCRVGSLGNDFILLVDPQVSPTLDWVTEQCQHHQVDGVLVLTTQAHPYPVLSLYNADGSDGEFCGNGIRAVAHYWYEQTGNAQVTFSMGSQVIPCQCLGERRIQTTLSGAHYIQRVACEVDGQVFEAHRVDVGNPHLVILQEANEAWLAAHGRSLEYYFGEAHRTNVEFVWPDPQADNRYHLRVFERGVGLTKACGSGAMAALWVLHQQGLVEAQTEIEVMMPGGVVSGHVQDKNIILIAYTL